jgi:hypothetical protein
MTILSATRGAPASSEIRNNNILGISGSGEREQLESILQKVNNVIGDSFAKQTVSFISDAQVQYQDGFIWNADGQIRIRFLPSGSDTFAEYYIPAEENLDLNNNGDIVYAVCSPDGAGTGLTPSNELTYSNENLITSQNFIQLERENVFYIPLVTRIDFPEVSYASWFFGYGVWREGTSAEVGHAVGGSGIGDITAIQQELRSILKTSEWQYLTEISFRAHTEERINSNISTAEFSAPDNSYEFLNSGEFIQTIDMLDDFFKDNIDRLEKVRIDAFQKHGYEDQNFAMEVSQDGGENFEAVTMENIVGTGRWVGEHSILLPTGNVYYEHTQPSSGINFRTMGNVSNTAIAVPLNFGTKATLRKFKTRGVKVGEPAGQFMAKIVRDDSGFPSTSSLDILGQSGIYSASSLAEKTVSNNISDYDFEFDFGRATFPAGNYWLVIETTDAYKLHYQVSDEAEHIQFISTAITGALTGISEPVALRSGASSWSSVSNSALYCEIKAFELELVMRYTAGDSGSLLEGLGIFYGSHSLGSEFHGPNTQYFEFSGSENRREFKVTNFVPDNTLRIYDVGNHSVYRMGVFTIQGDTVIFKHDLFDEPGTSFGLLFDQAEATRDDSPDNRNALIYQRFYNPIPELDFSEAGEGIKLRRRGDGAPRELVIGPDDSIEIYSLD